LIDCQVHNNHLNSLGAIEIDRLSFEQIIQQYAFKADTTITLPEWKPQDITLTSDHWTTDRC
jgi:Leu/Phe-tRNA-protein transferase